MIRFFSLTLLLLLGYSAVAQNNLDEFWELFKKNEYDEAISYLDNETSSNPDNLEAWLILSVLYEHENEDYKSFLAFKKAYELTENKDEFLQAYWHTGALYSLDRGEWEERNAFFQKVIDNASIDGSIKASIHNARGSYAYQQGEFDEHLENISKVGNLNQWQVVGEFENISASGYDKNYSPINQPEASARFKNKREAEIRWFNSELFRVGEWISTPYHFNTNNSIVFAQTFVNSPADQEVQLRIGTSGSLKAWVNDQLVLAEIEEYDNYADTYRTTVQLKKGTNRILIQLGSSEISGQNFMVRLTDEKGNPIQNITHSANYNSYPKVGGEKLNRIELPAEVYFKEMVAKNPDNLLYHILLSRIYMDNGKDNKAQHVLKDAEKLAPENSLILTELLQLYLNLGNETDLGATMEKLKEVDPNNRLTILLELGDAMDNEKYDEAEEWLSKIKTVFGDGPLYIEKKIALESARDNNQALIDLIIDGYDRYPENEMFVRLKYTVESNVNSNMKAAQKAVKKYLKKNFSTSMQKLYASSYAERNNIPKFFAEYKKLLEITPYSVGTMIDLGDIYYGSNQYFAALNYYDKALEIAPFSGTLYFKKGNTLKDMGKDDEALENFEKAILYNPRNFSARERIREIKGMDDPFDNFEEKDYYEIYKNAPSAEEYPEDNSVIVTEEKQVVIHEKGAVEEYNYTVIKVFDKAGVDFWKEYSIPRSGSQSLNIEKAEVLKPDGSKNLAETSGGYIVFTNLEPGDGIYLSYKLQNYYSGTLAEHYWGKQYFDYYVPAKNIEFSILYDENQIPLQFTMANGDVDFTEEAIGDKTLKTWQATDIESIKSESYAPTLVDIGRTLHYSTMPDWNYVANWYSDLAATKAKVDFEVEEIITSLFPEGTEGMSDEKVVKEIYEYIVNEIRYSSISFRQSGLVPQKASKVITTKIGDCKDVSTLFVAMCKEVGIDAKLVLVNTRNRGQHAMELPSIEFNHCIAKVELDGEERFVELTTDLYPFSTVSSSLEGAFILEIDTESGDAKPRLLPRSEHVLNAIYRKSEVALEANKMEVSKKSVKTGARGAGMRSIYRDEGDEAKRKRMQEAISGEYANIKLKDLSFGESLENNSDSVDYAYSYTVNNPYTSIGNLQIVKVPLADKIEPMEFLSVENRKFNVELWKYFSYSIAEEEVTLTMPEGKRLAEKPDNVKISNKLLDYELTFKTEGGKLVVYRKINFKTPLIELEDFELFKSSMEEIITADNLQIGFK